MLFLNDSADWNSLSNIVLGFPTDLAKMSQACDRLLPCLSEFVTRITWSYYIVCCQDMPSFWVVCIKNKTHWKSQEINIYKHCQNVCNLYCVQSRKLVSRLWSYAVVTVSGFFCCCCFTSLFSCVCLLFLFVYLCNICLCYYLQSCIMYAFTPPS